MSLNNLIKKVTDKQLSSMVSNTPDNINNVNASSDNVAGDVNIDNNSTADGADVKKAKHTIVDTRHQNKTIINNIFSGGDIKIADVDTRYSGAVNLHVVKNWKVAQIGAGGIGSPVTQTLVGMGISNYTIFDDDIVEVHNCGPQMHPITNIGKPKVQSTAEQMFAFRGITINEKQKRVTKLDDLKDDGMIYDVIINAVDNMDIRRILGWELLSKSFEKYKSYNLAIPQITLHDITYNLDNVVPIEIAIPTLLHDLSKIIRSIRSNYNIKSVHDLFIVDTNKLGLQHITVDMLRYITAIKQQLTPIEFKEIVVGEVDILTGTPRVFNETDFYTKYMVFPYINEDKVAVTYYGILSLLMNIDRYFIYSNMYDTVLGGGLEVMITLKSTAVDNNDNTDSNNSNDKDSINESSIPRLDALCLDEQNKILTLPILFDIPTHDLQIVENNVNALCNYILTNIPEVYIDSRMSLGTWNTYTLPLRDAYFQSVYLYWAIIGSIYGGSELDYRLRRKIPEALRVISNINSIDLTPEEISNILDVQKIPNMTSILENPTDKVAAYWHNMPYNKVSSSLCLCEFLTEALFDGSEAIQEPCTARAIVYTGVNIASYIGAALHYISSRQYAAGDIHEFIHVTDANDVIDTNVRYSSVNMFSQDPINEEAPFRWRHTFNSRSFLSSNDIAYANTIKLYNKYKSNYIELDDIMQTILPKLRNDLDSVLNTHNSIVISYIGGVLYQASKHLNVDRDTNNEKYSALFDISLNTLKYAGMEKLISFQKYNLTNEQLYHLYSIWLVMLLSCGYITMDDIQIDKPISIEALPEIPNCLSNKEELINVLYSDLMLTDYNTWNKLYTDTDSIGNSLLTLNPYYRHLYGETYKHKNDLYKTKDLSDILTDVYYTINKYIQLTYIDSSALGLYSAHPKMFRYMNIKHIHNSIDDKPNFYINNIEKAMKENNICISDALIIDKPTLQNKLSVHNVELGIINDNSLLKVYNTRLLYNIIESPDLVRYHYIKVFIFNICKNKLQRAENGLFVDNLQTRKIKNTIEFILQIDQNIEEAQMHNTLVESAVYAYSSDMMLLYSSNALLTNGRTSIGGQDSLLNTLGSKVPCILHTNKVSVPMSFRNSVLVDYNTVLSKYVKVGNDFHIDMEDGVLRNLVDSDIARVLNNIRNSVINTYYDCLSTEYKNIGFVRTVSGNCRDVCLAFPLISDDYTNGENDTYQNKGIIKSLRHTIDLECTSCTSTTHICDAYLSPGVEYVDTIFNAIYSTSLNNRKAHMNTWTDATLPKRVIKYKANDTLIRPNFNSSDYNDNDKHGILSYINTFSLEAYGHRYSDDYLYKNIPSALRLGNIRNILMLLLLRERDAKYNTQYIKKIYEGYYFINVIPHQEIIDTISNMFANAKDSILLDKFYTELPYIIDKATLLYGIEPRLAFDNINDLENTRVLLQHPDVLIANYPDLYNSDTHIIRLQINGIDTDDSDTGYEDNYDDYEDEDEDDDIFDEIIIDDDPEVDL